ncbi:bifunctional protein-disulfide isomerase/oxidoreductase DsbC [Thalassomonas sp. M1454]|uniref:bifunctional protein-disulfide isomerase/oxidoreductase DsbC n=1 Tax=Thalassomonas sp. M1454 TaxID=2594477 RepID=UPI00117DDC7C|nr:bifunctional protein-disulfide isomerase/oxidoreductase DsbC [Thalassomonas sp. M1454]TRX54552.1 bifunctional protein-disulfide isomerase/oxidoreductase DsbC [Thalassomonas sp. M1454]
MFKNIVAIVTASLLLITAPSQAANDTDAKIKANFAKLGLQAESINPSKMDNLFEVFTSQGLFYTNADGSFLIQGKLYEITDGGVSSLTEESLAKVRVNGMETFKDNMIVFPAEKEKYQVTVFTDLTCGYCRKLHNQMAEYNDMGITVRYLAFPRGGLASQSYNDMRSVWCSADQQTAMTNAKAGAQVAQKICTAPVAEQYDFGRKIGVTGTPAIMLDDGMMIPGYQTPEQMQKILQSYSTKKTG